MRLLLVEDDSQLGEATERALSHEGYRVDWVTRGEEATTWLRTESFDLLVLDWRLPDLSGLEVLRQLRGAGLEIPTLMLTARDATEDRVAGLDAGADDYLVKPFDLAELFARLRALARRGAGRARPLLELGDLSLDAAARQIRRSGRPLELSKMEYQTLEILMHHADRFVSKRAIGDQLYRWDSEVQSNTVEVYIHRLREILGKERIRTLRGVGYRLEPSLDGGLPPNECSLGLDDRDRGR